MFCLEKIIISDSLMINLLLFEKSLRKIYRDAFLKLYVFRDITMKYKIFILFLLPFFIISCLSTPSYSQQNENNSSAPDSARLTLVRAVMCEGIQDFKPWNQAVVFSISIGKVSCFTSFDPVPETTYIYHNWYYRESLSKRMKLFLQPPSWSTFSSIQFREADKGLWRVEITDPEGNIFHIVRFSITD
jgi:hypothetical protein